MSTLLIIQDTHSSTTDNTLIELKEEITIIQIHHDQQYLVEVDIQIFWEFKLNILIYDTIEDANNYKITKDVSTSNLHKMNTSNFNFKILPDISNTKSFILLEIFNADIVLDIEEGAFSILAQVNLVNAYIEGDEVEFNDIQEKNELIKENQEKYEYKQDEDLAFANEFVEVVMILSGLLFLGVLVYTILRGQGLGIIFVIGYGLIFLISLFLQHIIHFVDTVI